VQEAFKPAGYIKRYMDTWTLDEIKQCHNLLHSSMPYDDVLQRFTHWGGSPRYVFTKLDAEEQLSLQHEVDTCSVQHIRTALRGVAAHASVSDRLFHLRVQPDHITSSVQWASQWIAEQVTDRLCYSMWNSDRDELAELFKPLAWLDADLKTVHGALWTGYCHARLARGGTFRCRVLNENDNSMQQTRITQKVIAASCERVVLDEWNSLQQHLDGDYCTLRSHTDGTAVALRLPCEVFHIVAPVADKHTM
jgi:hypothetical protein